MVVKKNILAEVETKIKKETIIVSNTSSLSISEMAQALENPERFAGMHFFNPVNRMPLIEVIRGEKTSDKTIATVVRLSKKLGKTPIVVKDVTGFLVNRILLPCMNEAAYLLQEGVEIQRIDSVMEKFGMPMGPFILADVVGIDVAVKVAHSLFEGYGQRMRVADILDEIHNNHKELLGKKVGKGFYIHGTKNDLNPQIAEILSELKKAKNIHEIYISDSEIIDRCLLTMVNEAAKCLEENVVKNARYLDMAMIMGAGFPAFRGGVLRYADSCGIKKIVTKLQDLNKKHGVRFEVSKLLLEMAKKNQKFYQ
jgi:3-hydroxyacyl-CoA dehydrogenase/enoyl-CoA hydratase/3-hydroxybutyryl-CoA epimerase